MIEKRQEGIFIGKPSDGLLIGDFGITIKYTFMTFVLGFILGFGFAIFTVVEAMNAITIWGAGP